MTSDPIDYSMRTSKTPCAFLAGFGRKLKQGLIKNGERLNGMQSIIASVVSPRLTLVEHLPSAIPAAALVLLYSYSGPSN